MKLLKLYFNALQAAQKNLQTPVGWVQLYINLHTVQWNKSSPKSTLFKGLWRHSLWEQGGANSINTFMRPI